MAEEPQPLPSQENGGSPEDDQHTVMKEREQMEQTGKETKAASSDSNLEKASIAESMNSTSK